MKFIKNTLSSVATNAVMAFVIAKTGISQAYGKIKEKANCANMSLKEYVGDDENIAHISLVFYDILPLGMKLGLRYERFHKEFAAKFKTIRSWIYKYDDEQNASSEVAKNQSQEVVEQPEPEVKPAKKAPRKRTVKKIPVVSEEESSTAGKKAPVKRVRKVKSQNE